MISLEKKFIFIHIPKNAGSSIVNSLGGKLVDWDNQNKIYKQHASISQLKNLYSINIDQYFKFAFVRNPWDRAVSGFHWLTGVDQPSFQKCKKSSFLDFLLVRNGFEKLIGTKDQSTREVHFISQHEMIYIDGSNQMDFVGKFENLQKDFDTICSKIGIEKLKLPESNKSKHKHYTEYYTDETKDLVYQKYQKDIELFNYKFGD